MAKGKKPPKKKTLDEKARSSFEKTKGDPKKMIAYFSNERQAIIEAIETEGDSAALQIRTLKALLKSAVGILALSEKGMVDSSSARGAYASVAVATSIRDIVADIVRLSNTEIMEKKITEGIIDPTMMELSQEVMSAFQQLEGVSNNPKRVASLIPTLKGRLAEALKKSRRTISDETLAILTRRR